MAMGNKIGHYKLLELPPDNQLRPSSLYFTIEEVDTGGEIPEMLTKLWVTSKTTPVEKFPFDAVSYFALSTKFDKPNGTILQYIRGDGSLGTFEEDLYAFMHYKGTVDEFDDLPTDLGETEVGWVYQVLTAYDDGDGFEFPDDSFLVWNGEDWDVIGSLVDVSGKLDKVTTASADTLIYAKAPDGSQTMLSVNDVGAGFTGITTSNEGNVTFTGNGTGGSPLEANVNIPDISTTFVGLSDAPSTYENHGGKKVKVKVDETGLEFTSDTFTSLSDTPSSYTDKGGKVVAVKENEMGVEFIDNPHNTLTLEQARQNGNVLDGDVIFEGNNIGLKSVDGFSFIGFDEDGQVGMMFSEDGYSNYGSRIKMYDGSLEIALKDDSNPYSTKFNHTGILGNIEFNKQGDRKAFAQISDLQDQIKTRTKTIRMVLSPDGEDITTGDKKSFYMDKDSEFVSLEITSEDAPVGGVGIQVGLKLNGVDITDTPATIESGENNSFDSTPAEMTTTTFERGDKITPNVSAVGTTTKGKDLQLIFTYRETI